MNTHMAVWSPLREPGCRAAVNAEHVPADPFGDRPQRAHLPHRRIRGQHRT